MEQEKPGRLKTIKNRIVQKKNGIALAAFALALTTLCLGFGPAYAWLSGKNNVNNTVKTPILQTAIQEGNTSADTNGWDPQPVTWGADVNKFVRFANTGQSSILLRVQYAQSWTKTIDDKTQHLNNLMPTGSSYVPLASPHWTAVGLNNPDRWWYNTADGWYYYRLVLAPGEDTAAVMDFVSFAANPPPEYQGAKYSILFRAEANQYSLQAENENAQAALAAFGAAFTQANGVLTWSNP